MWERGIMEERGRIEWGGMEMGGIERGMMEGREGWRRGEGLRGE